MHNFVNNFKFNLIKNYPVQHRTKMMIFYKIKFKIIHKIMHIYFNNDLIINFKIE